MSEDVLTYEAAVALLPNKEEIHTFRQTGGILIGADWPRALLLSAMQKAPSILPSGPGAQGLGHGIVISEGGGWLFIETNKP